MSILKSADYPFTHLCYCMEMQADPIDIPYHGKITLTELKLAFNQRFPYLKWEFFYPHHSPNKASSKKELITTNPEIEQLNPHIQIGSLQFTAETTVKELEELVWNQFGLAIQVFRKSGDMWLETTITDQWSLGFQNEQGQELSEQLDRKN